MKKEQVFLVVLVAMGLAGIFWFTNPDFGGKKSPGTETSSTESVTETVTASVTPVNAIGKADAGIEWNEYTPGLAQAKNQEKNVFLYFYAQWCTYCTKLKQTTFKDKKVQAYLDDNFVSISVDTDQNQVLSQTWQVTGLPTMWFLTPEGERISSLPGYVDGSQLLKVLEYIRTQSYLTMNFQDFVRK